MTTSLVFTPAELHQLRMARAVGFAAAAIRRTLVLGDDSYLPQALEMLEEAA